MIHICKICGREEKMNSSGKCTICGGLLTGYYRSDGLCMIQRCEAERQFMRWIGGQRLAYFCAEHRYSRKRIDWTKK